MINHNIPIGLNMTENIDEEKTTARVPIGICAVATIIIIGSVTAIAVLLHYDFV